MATWAMTTEAGSGKRGAAVVVYEVAGEFSAPRPDFVSPQTPVR
jgi:hypothetical protein